jgi:capsular polysaccharide biosynthesis protein
VVVREADASTTSLEHRPVWRAVFHQWWLIALLAILGVLAGLYIRSTIKPVYEAEAMVQAAQGSAATINEDFSYAQTLFSSDAVLQPVIDVLGLDATPKELIGKGQLDSEAITGGLLRIIGRADDPDLAQALVNEAAVSFQVKMASTGLGTFPVLSAQSFAEIPPPSPAVTGIAGGLVGGLLGLGVLLVLFFVRQPLLTEKEALAEFPADTAFSLRVRPPSRFKIPFFGKRASSKTLVYPGGVIGAIWRSARVGESNAQIPLCCVLAERKKRGDRTVRSLLKEMRVVDEFGRQKAQEADLASLYWIQSDANSLAEALEPVGVVVTLVSEGAPRRLLRELAEELLVAPEQKRWTLVFVRPGRRRLRSPALTPGSAGAWPLAGLSHSPQPESEQTPARST